MRRPTLFLCLGMSAASFALSGCGGAEVEPEPIIRPVRTTEVFFTGGSRTRTFSGSSKAGTEANLSFRVAGKVEQVPVKVGNSVKAGQLLAELDDRDYRLQVQETRAALTRAEAEARNDQSNYERVRALYENRNASRNDLDQARATAESAKAEVDSYQKRLELAQLQLSYTRLSAPVDGDIASVDVEVNENVTAGQALFMLITSGNTEVVVAVPGVLISGIHHGDEVTVTFDAIPDRRFDAVITEVGVAAGSATTFPVTVRLTEEDAAVRSGLAAEVAFQFQSGEARERFMVPPVSVGEDRDGRFVFVVEPAEAGFGTARRKHVVVGEPTQLGLEVMEGLEEGDLLVTAGVSRIVDGQRVRLMDNRETP